MAAPELRSGNKYVLVENHMHTLNSEVAYLGRYIDGKNHICKHTNKHHTLQKVRCKEKIITRGLHYRFICCPNYQ